MLNEHGHSIALWHSISQVSAWTVGMIAVLFASYKWLRVQPWLLNHGLAEGAGAAVLKGLSPQRSDKASPINFLNKKTPRSKPVEIRIESRKAIDGKNALVVAQVGSERFLLASTHDGLSMLSKLEQGSLPNEYGSPTALAESPSFERVTGRFADDSPNGLMGTGKSGVNSLFPPRYPASKSFSLR